MTNSPTDRSSTPEQDKQVEVKASEKLTDAEKKAEADKAKRPETGGTART